MQTRKAVDIPVDVLLRILQQTSKPDLFACAQVCRSWFHAVLPFLWREIKCYADDWETLRALVSTEKHTPRPPSPLHKPLLKSFDLDYRPYISILRLLTSSAQWAQGEVKPTGLRRTIQKCNNLRILQLDCPALNDDDLWVVAKNCPLLNHLSFVSAPMDHARITDEGLNAICNCKYLTNIFIRTLWIQRTTSSSIPSSPTSSLIDSPMSAVSLSTPMTLDSYRLAALENERGTSSFTDRGIRKLASVYKGKLKGFGLEYAPVNNVGMLMGGDASDPTPIPSPPTASTPQSTPQSQMINALIELITTNQLLENFLIDWPVHLDGILESISTNLPSLKKIKVGNLQKINPLIKLTAHTKTMQSFSLFELNSLSDPTPLLQTLLDDVYPIEPDTLVTNYNPHLDYACTIRELQLDGVGFISNLLAVIPKFRGLTRLKVTPSRRSATLHPPMTDDLVAEICKSCTSLKHLEIPIIGDIPILRLSEHCTGLEYLDVVSGREITDTALILLIKKCSGLRHLLLGSAGGLTDNCINVLARSVGEGLLSITLPLGNQKMTGKCMEALAEHCGNLQGIANVPVHVDFQCLMGTLGRFEKLLVVGLALLPSLGCGVGVGRANHLSREEQDKLKGVCKKLKLIFYNI